MSWQGKVLRAYMVCDLLLPCDCSIRRFKSRRQREGDQSCNNWPTGWRLGIQSWIRCAFLIRPCVRVDYDPEQLSSKEQTDIIAAFKNPGNTQASGVRLAGRKFFTLNANDRSIYGKAAVRIHLPLAYYKVLIMSVIILLV